MSKPRISVFSEQEWIERRVLCQPDPISAQPGVTVEVEFLKGDHEAALAALERCVEDVKVQIAESHAPTWDGPRQEGRE